MAFALHRVRLDRAELACVSEGNKRCPPLDEVAGCRQAAPDPDVSTTHVVIIPSFNSGPLLAHTVAAARAFWTPVWVVIDGSDDGSDAVVDAMARADLGLRVLRLPSNCGKGAAVRWGLTAAHSGGFTHALIMDADGQHPADRIVAFMDASVAAPDALIMGYPVFGADAPRLRVVGRRLCNVLAAIETLRPVGDTLFGFRVYPVAALLAVIGESRGMRRFDFDPEAVVRLAWKGMKLIHLPAPVRYLGRAEGGISHFNYLRDNLLLFCMHVRLSLEALAHVVGACARWLLRALTDG